MLATDLAVIVPTRGRPDAVRELAAAFAVTCTAGTKLVFAFDDDDPSHLEVALPELDGSRYIGRHTSMVEALNSAVSVALGLHRPFAVGFMGDDHRPRTRGWDEAYLDALHGLRTGIVYGNDLFQGERLPTQVAMTADIVRLLGFMAPATLGHMYVDNFWRDLGVGARCLRYLPDVVVEHMHPVAGKADWSEGHKRVNAPEIYARDRAAYDRFRADGSLSQAVEAVRGLCS